MNAPVAVNFNELDWKPHPTIDGIQVKLVANEAPFSPVDVLVATVAKAGEIPWHVHERHAEIVYVVKGEGILYCAETQGGNVTSESPMLTGSAVIVPAGLWHMVKNIGTDDMLLFATHTS
jgi:mannose-6-phosphate isomerase-like protein (cupin superfamily)